MGRRTARLPKLLLGLSVVAANFRRHCWRLQRFIEFDIEIGAPIRRGSRLQARLPQQIQVRPLREPERSESCC